MKTINTSIRLPETLPPLIKKAAYKTEMSQAEFIRKALEKAVVLAGVKSTKEGEK